MLIAVMHGKVLDFIVPPLCGLGPRGRFSRTTEKGNVGAGMAERDKFILKTPHVKTRHRNELPKCLARVAFRGGR